MGKGGKGIVADGLLTPMGSPVYHVRGDRGTFEPRSHSVTDRQDKDMLAQPQLPDDNQEKREGCWYPDFNTRVTGLQLTMGYDLRQLLTPAGWPPVV